MKKKLSLAVVAIVLMPSLALASWWNPLTWFSIKTTYQTASVEQAIIPEIQPKAITTNDPATTTTAIKEKIIEKPVYKDRVVTQTITVDNPELQKKIDALIAENNSLRAKSDLCQANLQSLQGQKIIDQIDATYQQGIKTATESQYQKDLANLNLQLARVDAGQYDSELRTSDPYSPMTNLREQKKADVRLLIAQLIAQHQ